MRSGRRRVRYVVLFLTRGSMWSIFYYIRRCPAARWWRLAQLGGPGGGSIIVLSLLLIFKEALIFRVLQEGAIVQFLQCCRSVKSGTLFFGLAEKNLQWQWWTAWMRTSSILAVLRTAADEELLSTAHYLDISGCYCYRWLLLLLCRAATLHRCCAPAALLLHSSCTPPAQLQCYCTIEWLILLKWFWIQSVLSASLGYVWTSFLGIRK